MCVCLLEYARGRLWVGVGKTVNIVEVKVDMTARREKPVVNSYLKPNVCVGERVGGDGTETY